MRRATLLVTTLALALLPIGCSRATRITGPAGMKDKVRLITLDPGHFHAALVQKFMYDQVDPLVHIYAPDGEDLRQHVARVESFNKRPDQPTAWQLRIHNPPDALGQMLKDRPGNVVVLAGNNAKKTQYIAASVDAGLHVLADKPMAINPADYDLLLKAFETARRKSVLLYDIMTERFEVTNALQRELSRSKDLFGTLVPGTPDQPAITKESVHHFSKTVAGSPLKRPAWFFDSTQQGSGLVDVTTHLVDLVQWECFPGQVIRPKNDVKVLSARQWATPLTPEQFKKVTGADRFPDYLTKDVKDGTLHVLSNGELTYRIKGVHAKVSVTWAFEAPAGAGDTHYSMMRGTRSNLVIRQGADQKYKPTLYIENTSGADDATFETSVRRAVTTAAQTYPGIDVKRSGAKSWELLIPDKYNVGHEAHFTQVTQKYLEYLAAGKLPDWEVPNMIAKYHTIMEAYKMSQKQ